MFSPTPNTPKKMFPSPTGVIDEASQHWDEDVPAIPDILQNPPKQVRFSDAAKYVEPDWTRDDLQDMWWSKEEIKGFQQEAKKKAKGFRETHTTYIQALGTLLQECKNEPNVHKVLSSPIAQELLGLSPSSLRGLECHLHKRVGQYRLFHLKSLLAVQHTMKDGTRSLERLFRATARYTSRAARALARLLAQGDQFQVTAMIRQELDCPNITL
jgi:hypothetical protein